MNDRRTFLRGLVGLPLIGGSVALIGAPSAVAMPTSANLLQNYEAWLAWERYRLQREMWGEDAARKSTTFLRVNTASERWHNPWRPEDACAEPSTRAALVLATVGCPSMRKGKPLAERQAFNLSDVDCEVRDAEDVFIIIETVLNTEVAPLSAPLRDALATVARLGRERANTARHSLDKAVGVARV